MTRSLRYLALLLGLAAICWTGIGYVGANPAALLITLLIGAFYVMGAVELQRYDDATMGLARASTGLAAPPADLDGWLASLPASLRNPVRLRIGGERIGLPGPALTPYLTGLLVLLGMLGTFLGMVVTLKGTGSALEGAADLSAIRASLAAPVKGLGLAFGTSLAGVAASAMLGLASALCRRDRLQAAQLLDTRIAGSLRGFSLAHQREESVRLQQLQAEALPHLVERLDRMMATIERQSELLNQRLVDGQDAFHGEARKAYGELASSVDRSLRESLTEGARIAGATIQPVAEATMAGIAQQAGALHRTIEAAVAQQLEGLSTRLDASSATMAGHWRDALAGQQRSSETLTSDLRASLARFAESFEQQSTALVEGIATRLDRSAEGLSTHWDAALSRQALAGDELATRNRDALAAAAAGLAQHAASLSEGVDRAHLDLQAQLSLREEQRLSTWTASLQTMATALRDEWEQAGARTEAQQQQVCRTLADTARDIGEQAEAHARATIAEIAGLMKAASDAPRAAAEVIGELRQKLSDSMARDNAMLEERSRILQTLETLLGAVDHASAQQRLAIDSLVSGSAELLERVGARFGEKVEAESEKLQGAAVQVAGGAAEVASLGEAFGFGVQLFSESNDKLVSHLQRVEGALDKSIARSDEQLGYYVAQAREAIDLSILSQKQIVENLQRLSRQRSAAGSEA